MNNIWKQFGNTPMDYSMVASLFPNHKCKHNKVSALEKKGDIIRLKQGLYVSHPENSGQLLSMELMANHIYGPSYVSLHYALRYYGLIPERVYTVSSMTTKHSRVFYTPLARYEYVHVDENVFPIGIKEETLENGVSFMIATPEKALCDLISNIPYLNLRYKKELMIWLEEDMRFDMDELFHFDTKILREYAEVGAKKNMINQLIKIIEQ